MNPALKQRLVGATVLVALAVIFVPMLLERGSEGDSLTVRMEIPPKPEFPESDSLQDPPDIKPIEPLQPIEAAIAAVKPPVTATPEPEKTSVSSDKKPQPPAVAKSTEHTPSKAAATVTGKWLVQVGSFGREDNAVSLKDKLKGSGFSAYVETAKSEVGPVYRVRIGPVKNRADAEALVGKLSKQGGYRAIVLAID